VKKVNFYKILGIKVDATLEQVVSAFRELAHIYHPDKNSGESERFLLIRDAYNILKDEKERKRYNKENNFKQKKVAVKKAPTVKKKTPVHKEKNNSEYEADIIKNVSLSQKQRNDTQIHYSDAELKEFKIFINKKLKTAKVELKYLQDLIVKKEKLENDSVDTRFMPLEDGTMSMEKEQLSQIASRQITYIDHLEKAIKRIDNKTYGICLVTGNLIDKARLRAVPHATLSL